MPCLATTPADIQWMVQSGSGLALIGQKTPVDPSLTMRPIVNVNWIVDTSFVHPVGGAPRIRLIAQTRGEFELQLTVRELRSQGSGASPDAREGSMLPKTSLPGA